MIRTDYVACGGDGIRFSEHHIGKCDGKIADDGGMNHVAEVEQADDFASAHQHVVVIRIAMDDAVPQLLPADVVPAAGKPVDQRPLLSAQHRAVTERMVGMLEVPVQITVHGWMRECPQGIVDFREAATQ